VEIISVLDELHPAMPSLSNKPAQEFYTVLEELRHVTPSLCNQPQEFYTDHCGNSLPSENVPALEELYPVTPSLDSHSPGTPTLQSIFYYSPTGQA